ncbi:MAG: hypothetical protein A2W90_11275 [Bacteroidetes bacterium GWF2_42_66]|nr:MAG: hypothetical protein A2W92_10265 [Bacteroidetes bacterium GWA2_42_15]OFY01842.1 MAG: hypothetical protein A2W89_23295 [Bacteroidetes bacterium GWE2_42_39]OFY44863.1 MAG: hypothetical protein A2W90_11275 [Bacteroidetes bacterium GWF2_42_66]HBL75990.1 hypothetical protein [Prolixibacteraceae bacterium]HCR89964.1 hypothetical protein [Prolixibacteraceae bacterium]
MHHNGSQLRPRRDFTDKLRMKSTRHPNEYRDMIFYQRSAENRLVGWFAVGSRPLVFSDFYL